jgi:hypothetical protein
MEKVWGKHGGGVGQGKELRVLSSLANWAFWCLYTGHWLHYSIFSWRMHLLEGLQLLLAFPISSALPSCNSNSHDILSRV